MPKVSVIIPTYKHRDFVLATLDSVFAQTFTDYEVIVVNDGSPDDTADLLRPLASAGRIRYIEQENQGQGAARNRGLAEAQGEFVAFLDDDDLWPADKLEWQVARLVTQPSAVLVYGSEAPRGVVAGEDTGPAEEKLYPSGNVAVFFRTQNVITSPGQTLIRRAALEAVGRFDERLWGSDDWDLYIRLASAGDFLYDPRIALHYRLHAGNASKDIERMYRNACLLAKKHQNSGEPELRRLSGTLRRNIADNYANQYAQRVLHERDLTPQAAGRLLGKALRVKPTAFRDRCFLAAAVTLLVKDRRRYALLKNVFRRAVLSQRTQKEVR